MANETIGDRLRSIRESQALSQADWSQKINIGLATIKKIETDGNVPSGETLLKLAALGWNPGWILTGQGSMRLDEPSRAGAQPAGDEPVARLDVEALGKVMALMEEWLATNGRTLEPARKADLIARIYQFVVEDAAAGAKEIDTRKVNQFLRLVAEAL